MTICLGACARLGQKAPVNSHPMPTPPILEVNQLTKSFAGVWALLDAQLVVEASKVHVVMGENGAGKSTLMNHLLKQKMLDFINVRF